MRLIYKRVECIPFPLIILSNVFTRSIRSRRSQNKGESQCTVTELDIAKTKAMHVHKTKSHVERKKKMQKRKSSYIIPHLISKKSIQNLPKNAKRRMTICFLYRIESNLRCRRIKIKSKSKSEKKRTLQVFLFQKSGGFN